MKKADVKVGATLVLGVGSREPVSSWRGKVHIEGRTAVVVREVTKADPVTIPLRRHFGATKNAKRAIDGFVLRVEEGNDHGDYVLPDEWKDLPEKWEQEIPAALKGLTYLAPERVKDAQTIETVNAWNTKKVEAEAARKAREDANDRARRKMAVIAKRLGSCLNAAEISAVEVTKGGSGRFPGCSVEVWTDEVRLALDAETARKLIAFFEEAVVTPELREERAAANIDAARELQRVRGE